MTQQQLNSSNAAKYIILNNHSLHQCANIVKFAFMNTRAEAFEKLIQIMDDLREKCPWDRKQTIQSLRQMTLEESYELADAITESDWKSIKEELGDLLLHILFYSKIASEQNQFTVEEVIKTV